MIQQAYFSSCVKFFEKGFCERWNVKTYNDSNDSALFVGCYNKHDVFAINNHKGPKILWHLSYVRDVFPELDPKGLIVIVGKGVKFDVPDRYNIRRIDIPIKDFIQVKDFSSYKPHPLGEKVYIYLGKEKKLIRKAYGYDVIKELDRILPFDFIYCYLGHTAEYVRDEYYKDSFINIKPSIEGGLTTAIEMAYMGRKTVSNCPGPFIEGYKNINDICTIINKEAGKIGQTPKPLIKDEFFLNDWQNLI